MHKTSTSKFGHGTFEDRPLDDAELNAVTGGLAYEEVTFEYTERTLEQIPVEFKHIQRV